MSSKKSKRSLGKSGLVASSLSGFLAVIEDLRIQWNFESDDTSSPWYRGQQRKNWTLLPSIMRENFSPQDAGKKLLDLETESEIREEFVVRAPGLSAPEEIPRDEWDFYFLMQHYGAPTRLIDWTESPLIALYFAVRDNPGYYDSAVWVLDPFELNRRVVGRNEVIPPSALGTAKKDVNKVKAWLPPRFSKKAILPDHPVAVLPTHFARRISSQRSCFTIHGRKNNGFAKFQSKDPCLVNIVIPAFAAAPIRVALQTQGIDETTIFPDLQGLGRALVTKWRNVRKELPHLNVYVRLKPSPLVRHGVGVFAIRNIPQNKPIFAGENEEVLWIEDSRVPKGGAIRKLYDDFCIIKNGRFGSPTSFNRLTVSWFLNESKKPNVRCDDNYDFYALRNIRVGEELTVDYSTYSEDPDGQGEKQRSSKDR